MKKYKYRALDDDGTQIRGQLSAVNEVDLYQQLKSFRMELLDAKEQKQVKYTLPFMNRVKARELIQAFVHLEQLQRSGVPLLDSLADIRDSTDSPTLRDVMAEIYRDVSAGAFLSAAMEKHPKYFGNIVVSMTASAEQTGNLADAFAQLIVFMKWSDLMRKRTIKALTYPVFTMFVFLIVLSILMMYTVPQIIGFLRNIGQELPFVTVSLINTSDWLQAHGFWIPIVLFGTIAFVKVMNRVSPSFRYNYDMVLLKLPVIGDVIRKINLSRFSRTFGSLFKSGLEILKCIDTSTQTVGNTYMTSALVRARRQIAEGASISAAMNNTGEFPSLVIRMIKIGEESGNLTHVLDQVAEFYDADVDEAISRMIGMIQPTLTIILGVIIMWIAAGVFGPIYGILGKLGA
jgi:type IV pilus assembly protein PilC